MAAKPTPGGSDGTYGTELNEFLDVSLDADGKVKTEALQTDATAPVADAALANKKYVDDNTTMVPAVTGAGTGYTGQESVTFQNGLIMKMGRLTGMTGTTTAVLFDDTLNAVPLSIQVTGNTNVSVNAIQTSDLAPTGFTVIHASNQSAVFWTAIGR